MTQPEKNVLTPDVAASPRVSRRALLAGMAAIGPTIALSSRAFAGRAAG